MADGNDADGNYLESLEGRTKYALDFFVKKGWTNAQSAGIVANLITESNLLPDATGDNGKAVGIAQWHPARQTGFQTKMKKPMEGSSLDDQLEFVDHELRSGTEKGAGNKLKKALTATDAAGKVSRYYERPADKEGEVTRRGQRASGIYEQHFKKSQ